MQEILAENPLLLLFLIAAIGYGLGNVKIKGLNLGVSAVLFVGLAFGASNPDLHIPEVVIFLGLCIFVYAIGLQSAHGFFQAFRNKGLRNMIYIALVLVFSAGLVVLVHYIMGFDKAVSAGIFAGANMNTPALAAIIDMISNNPEVVDVKTQQENAVVGYSMAYPIGVMGIMFVLYISRRLLKVDFKAEEKALSNTYPVGEELTSASIIIENVEVIGVSLRDLLADYKWRIVFGRMERNGETSLTHWDTRLEIGDHIMIAGSPAQLEKAKAILGREEVDKISYQNLSYTQRRIFVSNPEIAGKTIASLNIQEKYAAAITRVRRGDMDYLAKSDTILELGDRVRFVARRNDLSRLSKFFGDSYDAVSKINLLSFGIGMALGLLLGMIRFQLPGGFSFQLGFAGGPLIVALILGAQRRTGPIVWSMPYSANLTLQQIGLTFLLAGIGVNAGHSFLTTLTGRDGFEIFIASAVLVLITSLTSIIIGYKILKIPYSLVSGMNAHQPAAMEFANQQAGNKLPALGFAVIMPVSIIAKIILAQIIYALL